MDLAALKEKRQAELKNLEQQLMVVQGAIAQINEMLALEEQEAKKRQDAIVATYAAELGGNHEGNGSTAAADAPATQLQHPSPDGRALD